MQDFRKINGILNIKGRGENIKWKDGAKKEYGNGMIPDLGFEAVIL